MMISIRSLSSPNTTFVLWGYDPYNAKEFVERWSAENGPYAIEKVIQGAKTESVPLGEIKNLSGERLLIFDQSLMSWSMGNAITLEDTNGNRKLLKKRQEEKIDNVAALMDAGLHTRRTRRPLNDSRKEVKCVAIWFSIKARMECVYESRLRNSGQSLLWLLRNVRESKIRPSSCVLVQ
jgi:hypothetical protein